MNGKNSPSQYQLFCSAMEFVLRNQGGREKRTLCEEKTRFKHTQLVLVELN